MYYCRYYWLIILLKYNIIVASCGDDESGRSRRRRALQGEMVEMLNAFKLKTKYTKTQFI